jgi:hypothetical protein
MNKCTFVISARMQKRPHYLTETLAKVYKEVIVPCVAGRDLEPDGTTLQQADVPQAGRPKGKRQRGASDKPLDRKKKAVSRCSRCRKVGHNSRSCKEQLEELVLDGSVECNAEDDNKNDEDGAMGGDEKDEEDDNEEDDEEESWGNDEEDDKGNDGDGKEKEDNNDDGKEKEDDEGEKLGAAVMFLSDDDTSSSDSVSSPTPPPPSKKIPKS